MAPLIISSTSKFHSGTELALLLYSFTLFSLSRVHYHSPTIISEMPPLFLPGLIDCSSPRSIKVHSLMIMLQLAPPTTILKVLLGAEPSYIMHPASDNRGRPNVSSKSPDILLLLSTCEDHEAATYLSCTQRGSLLLSLGFLAPTWPCVGLTLLPSCNFASAAPELQIEISPADRMWVSRGSAQV